jgi:hypothetical protein
MTGSQDEVDSQDKADLVITAVAIFRAFPCCHSSLRHFPCRSFLLHLSNEQHLSFAIFEQSWFATLLF